MQPVRNEKIQNPTTNNEIVGPESDIEPKQGKKKFCSKIKSFIRKAPKVVVASISGALAVVLAIPIVVIVVGLYPISVINLLSMHPTPTFMISQKS